MEPAAVLAILFPIFVIHVVGWATPGPNLLTILTASVTAGRGAGLLAGMGVAAGAFLWTLIAVSGIAVVFETVPELYVALRLVGAAYLIHLGLKALRAARAGGAFSFEPDPRSPAGGAPFRTGFLVMMTNPKAVLFFGSILTAFIPPDGPRWLMGAIVVQIGVVAALLNVCTALFFSAPPVMRAFRRASRAISITLGVLFCGLGLVVLWDVIA